MIGEARFQRQRVLRETYYGCVYLAMDLAMNRQVVCKLFNKEKIDSNDKLRIDDTDRKAEDPRTEMFINKSIDAVGCPPNVMGSLQCFEDSTNYYLVQEYCSGGDLFQLFVNNPDCRFHPNIARHVMRQIAVGIQFLHSHDIGHRDISPENVFITAQGILRVGDYGQAVSRTQYSSNSVVKKCGKQSTHT
jgi:serine/threonine protein kinase